MPNHDLWQDLDITAIKKPSINKPQMAQTLTLAELASCKLVGAVALGIVMEGSVDDPASTELMGT